MFSIRKIKFNIIDTFFILSKNISITNIFSIIIIIIFRFRINLSINIILLNRIYKISIKITKRNKKFTPIVFIVLPFCTIRSLFYCIFSLLGSAIVRLPLLPASHAPYFRSYASCFTSSSNSSPAE